MHNYFFFRNDNCNQFQSINQFMCPEINTHWTGHQGRTQPPLTGAHKNKISKNNKWQYLRAREKKKLVDRKIIKSNIHHKTCDDRRLKLEILAANTTLCVHWSSKPAEQKPWQRAVRQRSDSSMYWSFGGSRQYTWSHLFNTGKR